MSKRNLTGKQQAFVDHYLQCWNATEAARRAGYAGNDNTLKSIGSENLTKPDISAAVQKRLDDNAMSANEALSRLADIARGDIGDFLSPESLTVDISKGKTALIKRIEYRIYTTDESQTETVKIELHDSQRALETIARHHGLLKDTVVIEDWRSKAIELISSGQLGFKPLAEKVGYTLAQNLFENAGVAIDS
jgi:phage terminase small subunit